MRVLLVGKAPYRNGGFRIGRQKGPADGLGSPVAAPPAVSKPSPHDACIRAVGGCQTLYGGEISLEVAPRDAQPRGEVAMGPNSRVEPQRRHNLRPIRPSGLA